MAKYGLSLLIAPFLFLLFSSYCYFSCNNNIVAGVVAVISLFFLLFTMFFIRNPKRKIPEDENAIVSPADGVVIEICDDKIEGYDDKFKRISIFMSLFNVHVNRVPYKGVVKEIRYNPGKFHFANVPKASEENEQNLIIVETEKGIYAYKQIAGWVARRIVNRLKNGDAVSTGEVFGMIKFGSRLDIFVKENVDIKVKLKQKTKAGETIIGVWRNGEI